MELRPNCLPEELSAIMKDLRFFLELRGENVQQMSEPALAFSTNAKSKKPKPHFVSSPISYTGMALMPLPQMPKNALLLFREMRDPESLMREIENLNRNCRLFEFKSDSLLEINQHVRNRYFFSDYEQILYDADSFWKVWSAIVSTNRSMKEMSIVAEKSPNGELRGDELGFRDAPAITWQAWKTMKSDLRPRKLFTQHFVNERIDEKLKTGDDISISIDSYVRAYYEDCGHLHVGKILTLDEEHTKVLVKDKMSGQTIACRPWDLRLLPLPDEHLSSQSQLLKNLDKRALAASVLVLRQKLYVCKAMEKIKDQYFGEDSWKNETAFNDYNYLLQRLRIIDRHLQNIMLRLHVSGNKNVDMKDLKNHYVSIISKLKDALKKHKDVIVEERFKSAFDQLIASLQAKQERKIRSDVQAELTAAFGGHANQVEEQLRSQDKAEAFELILTMLTFLKQLNLEGDVNLKQNSAYKTISERYEEIISPHAYFDFADTVVRLLSKINPQK